MNKRSFIGIALIQSVMLIATAFSSCDNHAHTYDRSWKSNETHHWKEPTCGCEEISEYAEHSLGDDGFCWVCERALELTEGVEYAFLDDGESAKAVSFFGFVGQERVLIAEEYQGRAIKVIGDFCFDGQDSLRTVELPETIVWIGASAFSGCTALETVELKSRVVKIGANAFSNCTNLNLTAIPNSVTTIGEFAFLGCTKLKTVKIPDGVLEISKGLFLGCENLAEVTLGKGVEKIGESAFAHCSKLAKITISSGVEEIGDDAFNSCVALKSLVCPKSLTSIGENAFYDLTEILYYESDEQSWAKIKKSEGYMPEICYYSEDAPNFDETNGVRYWRYVDGEPTVWEKEKNNK